MIYDAHAHYSTEQPGISADSARFGFSVQLHSIHDHLEAMDHLGINRTLISCPTQKFLDDAAACADYIRQVNDLGAEIVSSHPDRFDLCCVLPLPYVDEAIAELKRVSEKYPVKAVQLISNANGQYLGSPALRPLFEEINRLALTVLLHPAAPVDYPRDTIAGKVLPMFEFIADTTRSVLDLMAAGYLRDFPNVRIVIPHTGSCLPMAIDRYIQTMRLTKREPGIMTDQIYYDIACDPYPNCLPSLLNITDPSHILFGSDYPAIPEFVVNRNIEQTKSDKYFSQEEWEGVLWDNAQKLFNN